MRKDHASLQDMARVPLGEAPGRPPRKVASADQLTSLMSRSPSADQLTSLMSRSPSLCGLTSLTVPGAPSASTNIPDGSTIVSSPLSRALSSHSKSPRRRKSDGATMPSPRPSGSGGYAPSSRVLLATIGPEKVDELQEPIMGPLDGFSLESTVARSLRDHQSPSKVAEPGSAGGSESASTHADSSPGISWITGTAPALSEMLEDRPYADFVNYTLRGIGQVCFCNNPFTGGLMLLALLWQSLYVATMGVIGVVAATATALLLGLDEGATRSGLFGFNGFLVGLGLATFDRGCFAADDCQLGAWHYSALAIPVVVIAALSTVFSVALGNLLVPVYSVPSFTLPFNLAAFLFLGTALDSRAFPQPRTQTLLADISTASSYSSSTSAASSSAESYYDAVDWLLVLEAVPKGVGQVFLADETLSGCVIVGALAVCSPGSAVVAVLGSGLGLAVGILMQVPLGGLYAGLWGYNAVLGCMAVGGVFFYPSAVSFALAGLCAVCCAFTGGLLGAIFTPLGIPTLTLPFCLGTLAFVLLQDSVAGLVPVPLAEVTTMEGHRAKAAAAATKQQQQQQQQQQQSSATVAAAASAGTEGGSGKKEQSLSSRRQLLPPISSVDEAHQQEAGVDDDDDGDDDGGGGSGEAARVAVNP